MLMLQAKLRGYAELVEHHGQLAELRQCHEITAAKHHEMN